ncbi:hypothetical protein Lal_00039744 [Lupinus albus]|nr:hypothetical protein Lal_00039744 [Lupinus albus]
MDHNYQEKERDNLEQKVLNYILYGNGKSIREIFDTSIQLVRTCLVLKWDQNKKKLRKIPYLEIRKGIDSHGSGLIPENQTDRTNINTFDSIYSKKKCNNHLAKITDLFRSLIILSSANCFKMIPFNYVKYHIVIKKVITQIKRSLLIPIKNSLGPLGIIVQVANLYSFYCLITHNQILITPNLQIDKFKEIFKVMKYYVMDGNHRIYKPDLYRNIVLNPFHLNCHFPIIIIVEKCLQ